MLIAIASGKGGTGKTTVAVNLALALDGKAVLADCDVEEPNCHLFLSGTRFQHDAVGILVPQIDESRCNACGECARFCQFSAIVCFGSTPLLFPEMCHGCGGCARVCPQQAIRDVQRNIGEVEAFRCSCSGERDAPLPSSAEGLVMLHGRLNVGEALVPPLIRAVQKKAGEFAGPDDLILYDSPPGTACSAAAALKQADLAVLVTEPTAFGLHDLRLAVELTRELGVPCAVVVNRHGSGDDRVRQYCAEENLPLLAEIPDDRRVAEAYSRGVPAVIALPEYRMVFRDLFQRIRAEAQRPRASRSCTASPAEPEAAS